MFPPIEEATNINEYSLDNSYIELIIKEPSQKISKKSIETVPHSEKNFIQKA